MKKTALGIFLCMASVLVFGQSAEFYIRTDSFLKEHVKDGMVDYDAIHQDPTDLYALVEMAGNSFIKDSDEKAYLINVYNLAVIRKVIQQFPMTSPQDDGTFFTKSDIQLPGQVVSLNHIENEILRKNHSDPRLHFVLVCGAKGCPQIEPYVYTTADLENQLDAQTKKALDKKDFIWVDEKKKVVNLSEIFKWYREDFGSNDLEVIEFINQYRTEIVPTDYSIAYYTYDWALNSASEGINLQTFTAGSLLGKGQMDFTMFNSMYTQSKSEWMGTVSSGFRETFVTNLFQFTLGVTKNKRFNVGIDFNLRYNGNSSDDAFKNVGRAFQFKNNDSTRFGLTSLGPRIKWQPFKKVSNFSIQSTIYFPTIRHPEGYTDFTGTGNLSWADWNRYQWWNQFFFDKTWNKFQIFAEVDLWFRFQRNSLQRSMVDIPLSLFTSWFPTKWLTIYAMSQHMNRIPINFQVNADWVTFSDYTASGGGVKFRLSPALNLELLYTNFWRGKNNGLGNTFNLGIKFIPQ
jgi:hypothetical protein